MTESQNKQILDHLTSGNGISQKLAVRMYDCYRLSARIKNLRDSGKVIYSKLVRSGKVNFAIYYMECSPLFKEYGPQFIPNEKG